MDLFGSPQSKPIFDDEPTPGSISNTSLFADDANTKGGSPWDFPTPKKGGRGDMVKRLLPTSEVPDSYVEVFDTIMDVGERQGAGIGPVEVKKILESTSASSDEQARLLRLVTPDGPENDGLGRPEFNVLLALLGLSQEGEDATLDGVDERRKNLPIPSIPYLKTLRDAKVSEGPERILPQQADRTPVFEQNRLDASPPKPRQHHKDSLSDDPWASPSLQKRRTQNVNTEATPKSNGSTAASLIATSHAESARTKNAFTTSSETTDSSRTLRSNAAPADSTPNAAIGWGPYDNAASSFPNGESTGLGTAGFGSGGAGDDSLNPSGRSSRALGGGRISTHGAEEIVTVAVLPEKEGMFLFQHRNYEVKSARRSSTVVRRYSDFVWLLDCLHKRYPFRQLPLLPPKRVGVNGRHLSSDTTFIEKRRRGLVRFCNALVWHPILGQEQLVVMFLTVPTELAVWRKQAAISVQEEFTGKSLPAGLEDSLPTNLADTFDTVRSGVRKSADTYIGLCNLLERLTKRSQGVAGDSLRFSKALLNLVDESESAYAIDTGDVPGLNAGIKSTAKHLESCSTLLEDEARAWDEGVLEDFKRQRDCLVSVRDMFDRRDRNAKDSIPQLERRIESNETKLAGIRAKPQELIKPGEQEKVEQAIMNDKQSIVNQHARGVFIKECIRDELLFFQQSQYQVSKIHQDWSQERVKYAELQADNWRALSDEVDNMPVGE